MRGEIRIHIDRLVLDRAFAHLDRKALGAAAEAELTRLLAEEGTPPGLGGTGRRSRVRGGPVELEGGADADAVGRQVARSLYRGLGR